MVAQFTKKEKKMLQGAADGDLGLVGSLLKQTLRVVDTALIVAAAHGHLAVVTKLLTAGAKPVGVDEHNNTALANASQQGHDAIVAKLLAAGASVETTNSVGETALTLASTAGHSEVVGMLLAAGANVNHANKRGTTALMGAAMYGHDFVVEKLLLAGANANASNEDGTTALITASSNGYSDIVDRLIVWGARVECISSTGETPLIEAATFGHVEVVQKLLSAGANVNAVNPRSETAFIMAAGRGHEAVCHALLCAGASQDVYSEDGTTALQRALKNGHVRVVALLQGYSGAGPSVDSPETVFQAVRDENEEMIRALFGEWLEVRGLHGRTPMHLAAELGRLSILQLLLERGASISSTDDAGATPLHVACAFGKLSAVSLLLLQGADMHMVDKGGFTPIEIAAMNGHLEIVSELARLGANLAIVSPSECTLLHHAVASGNSKLVMNLLETNVIDVNAVDARGWSVLHCAVQKGDRLSAALLLQHDVDVNLLTSTGEGVLGGSETALYGAVRLEDSGLALMLLRSDGINVNYRNSDGHTPFMVAVALGRSQVAAEIIKRNSQAFNERCFALTSDQNLIPSIEQLTDLVVLITSVHDLRWMLTLLSLCDPSIDVEQRTRLLKLALSHIIACKLVFDDDACVLFKLTLEHCEKMGLLQRNDVLLLDRQAEKVNMEGADWVVALKQQVSTNAWRLDAQAHCLRSVADGLHEVYVMATENREAVLSMTNRMNDLQRQIVFAKNSISQLSAYSSTLGAQLDQFQWRLQQSETNLATVACDMYNFRSEYVNRLEREARVKKVKAVCRVVASITGFVLAPVLSEVASAIVDFTNPIDVVQQVYGESDIALFLAQRSALALPATVQSQLVASAIRVDEFEELLREEIAFLHPEVVRECDERGLGFVPYAVSASVARGQRDKVETEEQALGSLRFELQKLLNEQTTATLYPQVAYVASRPPEPMTSNGDDIVHKIQTVSMASAPEWEGSLQPTHQVAAFNAPRSESVRFIDDRSKFPYHSAVQSSQGDVTIFQELLSTITPGVFAPNAPMRMHYMASTAERESICAAEYAYLLGYGAVGDAISARMSRSTTLSMQRAVSVTLEEDIGSFPFILAVAESQDNVDECLDCIDAMNKSQHGLEDRIQATVVRERSELVMWSAVELACHLGYVNVVKELFGGVCSDASPVTRIQAIKHARARATELTRGVQDSRNQ